MSKIKSWEWALAGVHNYTSYTTIYSALPRRQVQCICTVHVLQIWRQLPNYIPEVIVRAQCHADKERNVGACQGIPRDCPLVHLH